MIRIDVDVKKNKYDIEYGGEKPFVFSELMAAIDCLCNDMADKSDYEDKSEYANDLKSVLIKTLQAIPNTDYKDWKKEQNTYPSTRYKINLARKE